MASSLASTFGNFMALFRVNGYHLDYNIVNHNPGTSRDSEGTVT
jgi:hypothetical protein